jgi:hypothetical protein
VGVDLDYGNGSALTPSGIRPSDYQPGDEKELMDECEALARSVIKSYRPHACRNWTELPPRFLSCLSSRLCLTMILWIDAACTTTHRPIVWDIAVVKSDVPAPQTWMWTRANVVRFLSVQVDALYPTLTISHVVHVLVISSITNSLHN